MPIVYHAQSGEFHLYNRHYSYIISVLPNGQLGNLYFGATIADRQSFAHLMHTEHRSLVVNPVREEPHFSLYHSRQEYPSYGTGDYRFPAFCLEQQNGSKITSFVYREHAVVPGKPALPGLPATYTEDDSEAETLLITLEDEVAGTQLVLRYTVFGDHAALARSASLQNRSDKPLILHHAMSACVDLPDDKYEMLTLNGAWSRERHPNWAKLHPGTQSIGSLRGASSAEHNPFIALKRPETTEFAGEAYGLSLVYSGNHLEQVEVDTHGGTRMMAGIHHHTFCWPLAPGESFDTPEAVLVYSNGGLNAMSQTYHALYRSRLARGQWRDRERPILINNWEATDVDFTEEKLLEIAGLAANAGIELFVLDDGWFGERNNDKAGLGDWARTNKEKLPEGLGGLGQKLEKLGLQFGLWIEPEMVNEDSELYRLHPDWHLHTPERPASPCRNQFVLDCSRADVIDYLYDTLSSVIEESGVSYIKWDMNRYISECFCATRPAKRQGQTFHKYILGVYRLYDRLTARFPEVLFESCASGGARFDPGMLYYAPQGWTSDDTDAIERVHIQYGTSYVYPTSCMGAHVSCVPNLQVGRTTPLTTRAAVAFFGAFGYELDLTALSKDELAELARQVTYYKQHRRLFQFGTFYRLQAPFHSRWTAWMSVSSDRREAVVMILRLAKQPNPRVDMLKLYGLDHALEYTGSNGEIYFGDELMNAGLIVNTDKLYGGNIGDYASVLLHLKAE